MLEHSLKNAASIAVSRMTIPSLERVGLPSSTDHICVGPVPQTSAPSEPKESLHFNQYGAGLLQRRL